MRNSREAGRVGEKTEKKREKRRWREEEENRRENKRRMMEMEERDKRRGEDRREERRRQNSEKIDGKLRNLFTVYKTLNQIHYSAATQFRGVIDWYQSQGYREPDSVMSFASSAVTYTSVYTNSEPRRVFWGTDEELSNRGLEHPPSPVEVPYIPKPEYLEYLVTSDDEAPMENQPLPTDASPVSLSPGYLTDFDPEEDSKEDHADYPTDGGDDDDEPSDDDDDDDTWDKDEDPFEDEEEEEHLASADSSVTPVPFPSEVEVERLLALLILPPSLLTPLLSPLPQIPSPPLPPPPSSLHLQPPVPTSLPLPLSLLPPLPASLFIPPVDHREDTPEAELPPHKRLCLTALALGYEVGESSTAALRPTRGHGGNYRFISTVDVEVR
ncbi:hypothetical protein Tco_0647486 [Tanacetum coccineum]